MARIKCKNCGKAYRYETEGCCPECGAYNRPPRREQVNADGTIYHMKNNDYMEVPQKQAKTHSGKVCFEEKECYEEKVCYEDKVHNKTGPFVVAPMLNQVKQSNTKKNNNPTGVFVAAVCFMLAAAIGSIVQSCSGPRYDYDTVSYNEPYVTEAYADDDMILIYLADGDSVTSAWLNYTDENGNLDSSDADTIEVTNGDECILTFVMDNDYKDIESVDVYYGDNNWVNISDFDIAESE